MQYYRKYISMDAPVKAHENEKQNIKDLIPDRDQPSPDMSLMRESLRNEVQEVLSTLNDREANVLKLYFGIDSERAATLEEIGHELNLTRERVRQIKEKAIRSLRHSVSSKNLKVYLG